MSYDDEIIEDSGLLNQDQNELPACDDQFRRLREQYPEAFDVELAKRRERERSRRDVEEKRRWLRRNRKTPK